MKEIELRKNFLKRIKRFESVNKRKELSCSSSSETFNPCLSCYITKLKFHKLSREVFVEMGICFDRNRTDLIPTYNRVDPRPLKHSKAIIIFLIGGPGVGKSTLGKRIASRYGFVLVLVSALLREEVARGTEMGLQYKRFMEKGTIVPAPLIIQLLMQKMLAYPSAYGYLIVGFPRDKRQAILFNTEIKPPVLLVNLYARRLILQDRMAKRSAEMLRFDDTEEAVCNRIISYFTNVKSAIAPNKSVMRIIDAETNEEKVYDEMCILIEQILLKQTES